jgi:hypothetical protein
MHNAPADPGHDKPPTDARAATSAYTCSDGCYLVQCDVLYHLWNVMEKMVTWWEQRAEGNTSAPHKCLHSTPLRLNWMDLTDVPYQLTPPLIYRWANGIVVQVFSRLRNSSKYAHLQSADRSALHTSHKESKARRQQNAAVRYSMDKLRQ